MRCYLCIRTIILFPLYPFHPAIHPFIHSSFIHSIQQCIHSFIHCLQATISDIRSQEVRSLIQISGTVVRTGGIRMLEVHDDRNDDDDDDDDDYPYIHSSLHTYIHACIYLFHSFIYSSIRLCLFIIFFPLPVYHLISGVRTDGL